MLCVFKAMIRGSMEYGSFLFPFHNNSLVERLERMQRRALRYCVDLRRSSSTNVVYAKTGVSPIRQRFEFLAEKFILKSFALRSNILINKLYDLHVSLINFNCRFNLLDKFLLYRAFCFIKGFKNRVANFSKIPLFLFSFDVSAFVPETAISSPQVVQGIRRAHFPQLVFQMELSQYIVGRHLIFTDASKDGSSYLGAAIYSSLQVQEKYKLNGNFSVFSGECIAIIYAIDCILENGVEKTMFTDSRSEIDVISNDRIDRDFNYLVLVLKNKLISALLQGLDIILVWITAHIGILGNKTADLLAKEAIQRGKPSDYLPSHTDLYSILKKKYIDSTSKSLLAQAGYKRTQYFALYPSFSSRAWFVKLALSRMETVIACRIRSNHYNLNFSLFRCGIVGRPDCDCGVLRQDITHVLWSCFLFAAYRGPLLRSLERNLGFPPPYNDFELMKNPSHKSVSHIVSFLHKSDLLV